MIYQNSRPVTPNSRSHTQKRRFEWRDFVEDSQDSVDLIHERFELHKEETCLDRFFLLPGRSNQIATLNDNDTFEIKTMIDEEGPLELWETTAKSKVPLRRTLAKMIGARIPKFSGPVVGSMTPEELSESLSKKTHFFQVEGKRQILKRGGVTAKISRTRIGDTNVVSIAFESAEAEPLLAELKALGLRKRDNTNFGTFLLNS